MAGTGSIHWREWGPDAFSLAEKEGKLIFLDISAKWCHWCHVLDRTSLSDPGVIRMLNDEFIPVRVDTDRRPDINDRYNQGGWPTTAVLDPNGRLLTGATYLPADALFEVLRSCAEVYRRDRGRVETYLREIASRPSEEGMPAVASDRPQQEDLSLIKRSVLASYDPMHPGFFREPKFLMPEILAFLRDSWVIEGKRDMGDIFLKVLLAMGSSAVFDAVEGGFFRYATRRDWTAPHYEKLLVDNGEMLSLYASAYEKTGEETYARVARETVRFLYSRLRDPGKGAFFSSQDADEEYYLQDAEGRSGRIAPLVDGTIISEYNGRAVSALVSAHRAFGGGLVVPSEEGTTLLSLAGDIGEFLHSSLWDREQGQIRFREKGVVEAGHLADNESVAEAYLDLWEAGRKEEHLALAGEMLDWSVRRFFSSKARGFLDRLPREGDAGPLNVPLVPFSLNARMACVLMRYCREARSSDLIAVAELTLMGLSAEFGDRAAFGAPYGSALLHHGRVGKVEACLPGDASCRPGRTVSG